MTTEFELHYHCSNGGDGSVGVHFHQSEQEAQKADEEMEDGWGESSAHSVKLKLENDRLYFREYEEVDNKYQWVWKEIQAVK